MTTYPNMPDEWIPPYRAWSARTKANIGILHLGVQGAAVQEGAFTGLPPLPARHIDRAAFTNAAGVENRLLIAYFASSESLDGYLEAAPFQRWWRSCEERTGLGFWQERYVIPPDRLETLYSFETGAEIGIRSFTPVEAPIAAHAYDGAARDRLAISRSQALSPSFAPLSSVDPGIVPGRVVVTPPENLAVIRSGQDWSQCKDAERATYLDTVHPELADAMTYLRDNPAETGAVSCNLMQELDPDGRPLDRTFGLAQFRSLEDLERWSASHPTHVSILTAFFDLLERFGPEPQLRLYHEIFVLPPTVAVFEYINCRRNTGLLSLAYRTDLPIDRRHSASRPASP